MENYNEDDRVAERILVIGDEEPLRRIIVRMLTDAGYQCREADGLEALALLESDTGFELVLSSLMMLGLDGIGLLERVKEKCPEIPVVIMSAVDHVGVVLGAIRNGAYDYLLKPFDREQLLNVVKRALEHRRLKQENRTYQKNLESLVNARTAQLQASLKTTEQFCDITLEGVGTALSMKDEKTAGHSKRVTAFSIAIARAMGLPTEEIAVIARAAFLHDIGKIAVPDKILLKPCALTPDETAVVREHCLRGYRMITKFPFLDASSDIVYAHHESFDGAGYPRGLKGEGIPLGARIVAVANTMDSITSELPYRAAQSLTAARSEIENWSGRQFDPQIVQVFLKMPDQVWSDLTRKNSLPGSARNL